MGLLQEDGLTQAVQMKDTLLAECVLLSNCDLDETAVCDQDQEDTE